MICVVQQPEPASFDIRVRKPGKAFLATNPNPSEKQLREKNFWTRIQLDLYTSYNKVCAYTSEFIPRTVANSSVDHFWPKSTHVNLIYEWSNYRLASQKANNNKGNHIGLVDPFEVKTGWFILEIPTCLIKIGENLSSADASRVENTINVLKLNSDDEYAQSRCDVIEDYINGDISFNYLWKMRPFIAHELTRQGLTDREVLRVLFKHLG
jgi:hypothetical protein